METNILNSPATNQTVSQALSSFYEQHDFGADGGVSEKVAWIKFGFFSIPIPNASDRRNNIYLHDISHLVTGKETNWKDESAVSAWEIATGGWKRLYIPWLLSLWAMGLGVVFYPKSVLESFRKGLRMRNALTCGLSKEEIMKLSVAELKTSLSNHPKSNKNPFVWMLVSFCVFFSPFLLVVSLL